VREQGFALICFLGGVHPFQLLWVILIGLIFALVIQSLAANLGVVTGDSFIIQLEGNTTHRAAVYGSKKKEKKLLIDFTVTTHMHMQGGISPRYARASTPSS
jgi:hypothetical protein